jgi:hypothetical protein
MRLYTYFRAMEMTKIEADTFHKTAYRREFNRLINRYARFRDGLICRMERITMERDNLKAEKVLLKQWLAEAEGGEG